ncbi:MAG TPA: hypothetical protein VGS19_05875, partial [Streptosporangiaceae bacterium]|nr:hypothetical protein [Streptosporangiaceae bacterium]
SARYPCPHVLLLADWDTKPALSQQEDASLTDHPGRTTRLPRRVYYYGTVALGGPARGCRVRHRPTPEGTAETFGAVS